MKDLAQELESLCDVIEDEISSVNSKLTKTGGKLSGDDVSYIDKLTHSLKSIKSTLAIMDGSDGYSMEGRSYRGDSYARRRDSMGRYSRDYNYRGYSMDKTDMVSELRDLMHDAPDERTRMEFDKFIRRVESM
jgi:hypothetical protein